MKYKIALIGLGHQSSGDYMPGIVDSHSVSLKAVCDIDAQKVETYSKKLAVKGYSDYRDLLKKEHLDFVIVVVPHDVYPNIVKAAAEAGVHVLKEKPFARNLQEAQFLNETCETSGICLMTTLQRRFNPIYATFFQLINEIGEVSFIDAKYTLFLNDPNSGWRGDRERAGGGCLIDMGYHMIDMLIWYFGLPLKLFAEFAEKPQPETTALVSFVYSDHLHGSLILSRNYPPKREYIRVVGTKGIVEVERGRVRRLKSNGNVSESLIREHSWPLAATKQIEYFCKVIEGEAPNIGSPKYHLQHVRFIEACYKSKLRGSYVNPIEL